jgi:phosphonate transport system substrate-binding protein
MLKIKLFLVVQLFLLLSMLLSCSGREDKNSVRVNFDDDHKSTPVLGNRNEMPVLRIAIAPVLSPKESFVYYRELFDYIGSKLQVKVEFRQRMSYQEVNQLLEQNLVDIAFICTGAYVDGQGGFDLLVAPVKNNNTYYQAYIITNVESGINSFDELRKRSFAFTDPISNTGSFYPKSLLSRLGESPEHFFSSVINTGSHDLSIQMVSRNLLDGASVNGLVFEYYREHQPELVQNIRVIQKSESFGMPHVVSALLLDSELREKVAMLLLELNEDEEKKKTLAKLSIDGFVLVDDSIYNSARVLNQSIWKGK